MSALLASASADLSTPVGRAVHLQDFLRTQSETRFNACGVLREQGVQTHVVCFMANDDVMVHTDTSLYFVVNGQNEMIGMATSYEDLMIVLASVL